jgi:hypothetical protein
LSEFFKDPQALVATAFILNQPELKPVKKSDKTINKETIPFAFLLENNDKYI